MARQEGQVQITQHAYLRNNAVLPCHAFELVFSDSHAWLEGQPKQLGAARTKIRFASLSNFEYHTTSNFENYERFENRATSRLTSRATASIYSILNEKPQDPQATDGLSNRLDSSLAEFVLLPSYLLKNQVTLSSQQTSHFQSELLAGQLYLRGVYSLPWLSPRHYLAACRGPRPFQRCTQASPSRLK